MTGTRELRSIERAIRFMETVDESNESIGTLKSSAVELRESVELGDDDGVSQALEEMGKAMLGMEYMDDGEDGDDMALAVKSMKSAMKSMKGNAPSHDYSSDDGEYSAAMDDMDDMDEDHNEYIAYLEGQIEEHREALRTVTSAYITSKGLNRIPQAQQAAFMEGVTEGGQRPNDFETLTMFEEYFDGEVAKYLGEDVAEGSPVNESRRTGPVEEVHSILSEDSPMFQNIQYLAGGKINS